MRRGRRPHPDLLTPRELEVIALVREGLSNEQIAQRLGISVAGVKYHVSEILSKLQVEDRIEAARWYDRSRARAQPAGLGLLARFLGRLSSAWRLAGAAALVVATMGVIALLTGVLLVNSRSTAEQTPLAPDGRSGDTELDSIVESLLQADAAQLASRYAGLTAERNSNDGREELTTDEWTGFLAESERELYAVHNTPFSGRDSAVLRHTEIILRVSHSGARMEAWHFAVRAGSLLWVGMQPFEWTQTTIPFDAVLHYEDFLVLPPKDERLHSPPASHVLDTRTGHDGVDGLIGMLQQRDSDGLRDSLAGTGLLPVRTCDWQLEEGDRRSVARDLADISDKVLGVQAVVQVPPGYQPSSDHLLVLITQEGPYSWQAPGLLEQHGRIVGLIQRCDFPVPPSPEALYPPSLAVAPMPGGPDRLDPSRRSGDRLIDTALDALAANDVATLAALVEYSQLECTDATPEFGTGGNAEPSCLPDEPRGTRVEVLPMTGCGEDYVRRTEVVERLQRLADVAWTLYAALELGNGSSLDAGTQMLLAAEESAWPRALTVDLTDGSITAVACISGDAASYLERVSASYGRTPSFLLPPP